MYSVNRVRSEHVGRLRSGDALGIGRTWSGRYFTFLFGVACVFRRPDVSEIAVRAHEHRGEVSEQPIVSSRRQVNTRDPLRTRRGFFMRRALQPDPAAILKKTVKCRP